MGYYDTMQVCLNGHQITASYEEYPEFRKNFCDICGEKTITSCPQCKTPIQGKYVNDIVVIGFETPVPDYCHKCGAPYPWTKRKATKTKEISSREKKKTKKDKKLSMEKGKKVFIVHGHDEKLKNQLEIFLTEIGLSPVILHRKPDEGLTIIEKFEKYSDVGYAFILLTPDDISYSISEENIPEEKRRKERRARQNVVWEFGFFVGKLGRNNVCCLYKEGVTLPSDVSGMIYKEIGDKVDEVSFAIIKDLRAAGYDLKLPLLSNP